MSFFLWGRRSVAGNPWVESKSNTADDRLRVMGIHIDLRPVQLAPSDFWFSVKILIPFTFQKAIRSRKRSLDYRENKKCYKRLLLVNNHGVSDQSVDKSSLFTLLLVMHQGSVICILKLCRLEPRLWRPSGVLYLVINKVRSNGHPLLLHPIINFHLSHSLFWQYPGAKLGTPTLKFIWMILASLIWVRVSDLA